MCHMTNFLKLFSKWAFKIIKHLSISKKKAFPSVQQHSLVFCIDSAIWMRPSGRRCSMPRNWRSISRRRPIRSPVLRFKTRGSRKVTTELDLCDTNWSATTLKLQTDEVNDTHHIQYSVPVGNPVTWCPCQNPGFPCRILNCSEIINVTHFYCRW